MSALPPPLPPVRDTAVLPVGLASSVHQTPLAQPVARYAGFGARFLAFVIDACLLTAFLLPPLLAVNWALAAVPPAGTIIGLFIGLSVGWVYFAAMESSPRQGTIGKVALGLIVTDLNSDPVSLARASIRYVGKACSTIVFCLGFVVIAFSTRRQALHDMIAGCLVIRK